MSVDPKGSFIVFHDWLEPIEHLSDADCGRLFRSMIKYSETGEIPSFDGAVAMAFAFIRPVMDRNAEKWEDERRQRSEAGRKGGIAKSRKMTGTTKERLAEPSSASFDVANAGFAKQTVANLAVNVNECVNVHDPVNVGDDVMQNEAKSSPRSLFKPPSIDEVKEYCAERGGKVDPQRWYDYYQSNGWKVGRNPMKDWRAAVRSWETNLYSHTDSGAAGTSTVDRLLTMSLKGAFDE